MSESAETAAAARGGSGSSRLGRTDGERPRRGVGRIRSIGVFYRQVIAELRKVIWPTRQELITYTSVVLVFVIFMVVLVSIFDFAFSQLVLKVFGGDPNASG